MLGFRFLGVRAACKGRCHGPTCVDTQCSWPLQAKTGGSSWTLMEVFTVRIIKGDIQEFRQWLTWDLGLLRRRVQREQLSTITRRSPGFVGEKGNPLFTPLRCFLPGTICCNCSCWKGGIHVFLDSFFGCSARRVIMGVSCNWDSPYSWRPLALKYLPQHS